MRVLLDENVPAALARQLSDHEVRTVGRMRWSGIKNGALLARAAVEFDLFLTLDRSSEHQQVLPATLPMVTVRVPKNKPETLLTRIPDILEAIGRAQPGSNVVIQAKSSCLTLSRFDTDNRLTQELVSSKH